MEVTSEAEVPENRGRRQSGSQSHGQRVRHRGGTRVVKYSAKLSKICQQLQDGGGSATLRSVANRSCAEAVEELKRILKEVTE